MSDQSINWKLLERELDRTLTALPGKVGTVIVNWSKSRFRFQNWVDGSDQPWQPRNKNAKRNKGRAILISSGRLRRSIRPLSINRNSVTVGSDVPYAAAHNDGVDQQVQVSAHKRRSFKKVEVYGITSRVKHKVKAVSGIHEVSSFKRNMRLPRRRFLGDSVNLNQSIQRTIYTEIRILFK